MVNSPVLVLNQNYEPLNVCRARRAVVLLWRGKAEGAINVQSTGKRQKLVQRTVKKMFKKLPDKRTD